MLLPVAVSAVTYDVVPLPQSVDMQKGAPFILDGSVQILSPVELQQEADFLQQYMSDTIGNLFRGSEGNTAFKLDNGVLLNAAGTRLLVSAHEGEIGTSYSNATVTSIDNYGLAYAPFTSVDLPALTNIGNYGFAYSDIEAYTLNQNVSVGQNVFAGSALREIVIGEGIHVMPGMESH